FSDPGGSMQFPSHPSFPDAGGSRPYLPGPPTARSGEVQTPHTSSAPTPSSTPMPKPPSRPGLRYLMLGGLACCAAVAVWLLMPGRGEIRDTIPSASAPSSAPAVPVEPPTACPGGMLLIPGATFVMGSNEGRGDERPAHEVKVESFCMDVTEVTGTA